MQNVNVYKNYIPKYCNAGVENKCDMKYAY